MVSCGILSKFELIIAFMVALVICKNEEDLIQNEGLRKYCGLRNVLVGERLKTSLSAMAVAPLYHTCAFLCYF